MNKEILNYATFQANDEFVKFQQKNNVRIVSVVPYVSDISADTRGISEHEHEMEMEMEMKTQPPNVFVVYIKDNEIPF